MTSRKSSTARKRNRSGRTPRYRRLAAPVLVLLTVAVFSPLLNCGLLWTEFDTVERTVYDPGRDWRQALETETVLRDDPFSVLGYHLEARAGDRAPMIHRAVNIALHSANVLLLLAILRRFQVRHAAWAAALFAVHPAVLQVVFWPGFRPLLSGMLLLLAAVHLALRNRGPAAHLGSLTLAAAAALLHPVGLVMPLLVVLLVCLEQKKPRLHHFNRALPYAGIALVIGLWLSSAAAPAAEGETFGAFIERAAQNFNFYLREGLPPTGAALFVPLERMLSTVPRGAINVLPFLVFLPALALVIAGFHRPWSRVLLLGAGAFGLLILGGLFIDGRALDGSPAFETRGVYFALPAVFALVAAGAGRAGPLLRPLLVGAAAILVAVEAGVTTAAAYALRSERLVWEHFNRSWPDAWTSTAALVDYYQLREPGAVEGAVVLDLLERAVELHPGIVELRVRYARLLEAQGRDESAINEYLALIEDDPANTALIAELAEVYRRDGREREMRGLYERLLVLAPDNTAAAAAVARQRLRDTRYAEAIAILERASSAGAPTDDADLLRAAAYADAGRRDDALALATALRKRLPDRGLPLILSAGLSARQSPAAAAELAESAIRTDPYNAETQRRYARFLIDHGDDASARAVRFAESADRLSGGNDPVFLRTLATCYRSAGQTRQATQTLERALRRAQAEQLPNLAAAIQTELEASGG